MRCATVVFILFGLLQVSFSESSSEEDSSYTEEDDSDYHEVESDLKHSGISHESLHLNGFRNGSMLQTNDPQLWSSNSQLTDRATLEGASGLRGHSGSQKIGQQGLNNQNYSRAQPQNNHEKKHKIIHHGSKHQEFKPIYVHF
ncbi:unnamed protein product [Nezara viridula]|uniref:Neuropeptide n=1 Tax=Nezara viridula TaxID=85310 RepID=A0A9P0MNE7_NEZVI|nr:unnamed protein product [Nezara viridula]